MNSLSQRWTYAALLLLAAAIWGEGFVATKWALREYSAAWSNAFRYLFAGSVSLIYLLVKKTWKKSWPYWRQGLIASVILMAGMLFQIYGLLYTSVAKSGFLTSFYAFFIPLMAVVFRRQLFRWSFWLLLLLALSGVAMLCNLSFEGFNRGDLLTLGCALCFALHIDYLGQIAPGMKDPFEFNAIQCFVVAVLSTLYALLLEPIPSLDAFTRWEQWWRPGTAIFGIWFLGLFSSYVAFAIQVAGQRHLPAAVAGMIFLLESPFAAVFGAWQLGEQLSTLNIFGCVLVMGAVAALPLAWGQKQI